MNVSVVIPAFNEERRIEHCLKSILNQTQKPYELIVVDNNSSDKTAEIAKSLGATVIFEPKKGIISARNAGFNAANGEIIARTDADTIVPSNWIETIINHFEKDPKLLAFSGPAIFGHKVFTPLVKLVVFETNKKIFGHNFLYGPNMALRKDVWEKVKNSACLDDELVHEDFDLSIHIGQLGKVGFDNNLKVRTSARRMKNNPTSFFVDYNIKTIDMITSHKGFRISTLASKIKRKINYQNNSN